MDNDYDNIATYTPDKSPKGLSNFIKSWFGKADKTEMGGGIMFFSNIGQSKETRFSPNAEIGENIDLLTNALSISAGMARNSTGFRLLDNVSTLQNFNQAIQSIKGSVKVCTVCGDTLGIFEDQSYHTGFDTIEVR